VLRPLHEASGALLDLYGELAGVERQPPKQSMAEYLRLREGALGWLGWLRTETDVLAWRSERVAGLTRPQLALWLARHQASPKPDRTPLPLP